MPWWNCLDSGSSPPRMGQQLVLNIKYTEARTPELTDYRSAYLFCVPALRCGLNGPRNCSGLFRMYVRPALSHGL